MNFPIIEFKEITVAYQLTMAIVSIGLIIGTLEDINGWAVFEVNGILSWKVARLGDHWSNKSKASYLFNFLLNDTAFKCSLFARLALSIAALLLALLKIVLFPLVFLILLLNVFIALRNPYGLDGAYQMNLVILFALSIGVGSGINSSISHVCLWFIAGELLIAYFISGFTKLLSPMWRKSLALRAIFSTKTYGHPFIYQLISRNKTLASLLSWAVMIFETFFFIVLFLDPIYVVPLMIIGFSFHLFNAVFMGLNDFLFAFSATYPSLIYCVYHIHLS